MSGPDRYADEGASERRPDEMDAFETLRATDPVDPSQLPDAHGPHARALYQELTMDTATSPTTATRRRFVLAAVTASTIALGAIGLAVFASGPAGSPDAPPEAGVGTSDGEPPSLSTMCVESYSLETLANRELAFDGTLTAVDGDRLTFDVHEVFAGEAGETIVLGGANLIVGDDGLTSVEGAGLTVGDRALVAGSDGFAWACGFTQPYDPAIADQWRDTLG